MNFDFTFNISQFLVWLTVAGVLVRIFKNLHKMGVEYQTMKHRVNVMWRYNLTRGMLEAKEKHFIEDAEVEP